MEWLLFSWSLSFCLFVSLSFFRESKYLNYELDGYSSDWWLGWKGGASVFSWSVCFCVFCLFLSLCCLFVFLSKEILESQSKLDGCNSDCWDGMVKLQSSAGPAKNNLLNFWLLSSAGPANKQSGAYWTFDLWLKWKLSPHSFFLL